MYLSIVCHRVDERETGKEIETLVEELSPTAGVSIHFVTTG